ncbi:hypothetical protein ACIQUQ_31560 [Streptomyces sp. NPDC101118]|uniref:hypothetical protein n=1 Tax=Streptomyces sp. NPDC101118 TaxID=3366109 RepID=UPI0037FF18FB
MSKEEMPARTPLDRRVVAVALAVLLACLAFITYGVLSGPDLPARAARPTAEVTYEVGGGGAAEVAYLGRDGAGRATVERVRLPWRTTVRVPLGQDPVVSVTLDGQGGQASCSLAIRGRHVQRATASGAYGRATCTGSLPAADPAGPAGQTAARG